MIRVYVGRHVITQLRRRPDPHMVSNMDEIGQFYVSSPGDGIKMCGGAFAANTSGITAAIFTRANAATFLARERRGMYPA